MNNNLIGWKTRNIISTKHSKYDIYSTKYTMQFKLGRIAYDVKLDQKLYFNYLKNEPHFCKTVIINGKKKDRINCVYLNDKIIITHFGKNRIKSREIISKKNNLFLSIDNYSYLKNLFENSKENMVCINTFTPPLFKIARLKIKKGDIEEIVINDKNYLCQIYNMKVLSPYQMTIKLWIDITSNKLIRYEQPLQELTVELADKSIINNIKRLNLVSKLSCPVDVYIPHIKELKELWVKTKMRVISREITKAKLESRNQTFKGTIKDNLINGVFIIKANQYYGKGAPNFPQKVSDSQILLNYLSSKIKGNSNNLILKRKAEEITKECKNSWSAAVELAQWVNNNIKYDPSKRTAEDVFLSRRGNCEGFSLLHVVLCRSIGIPARLSTGYLYSPLLYSGSFIRHVWTEVYMGKDGWIPLDPALGEYNRISVGHIKIPSLCSKPERIEIIKYSY